ncbi:hypothetical protein PIB30_096530 [Stylosanthes scabra]|uniref:Disease resistance protein At4g27190-like leucine-rich repeats domain-containing protein n=1 Tax=Stylosanthes scabra TaxID=79078 RepID=A0ABU6YTS6_9FABA|nr:hypothetical protein [Stylosanthes scabra]
MDSLVQNIESLTVLKCHGLTNLVSSTTVLSSSLTRLKVEDCPSLKYLISSSTVKSLVNLQELYISNCEALESVVAYQPHDIDDVITFQGLKKLSLSKIPKLESFYTPNSTLNFPYLEEVMVTECNRLEYLFSFSTAKSLKYLSTMKVSECESLETVVVATREADELHEGLKLFSCLRWLNLHNLPKLGSFFTGNSTLELDICEVSINQCKSMKTFSHNYFNAENVYIDGAPCSNDLNAAVSQQFDNRMKKHH